MFDDSRFHRYELADIPLNRDIYLVDELYAQEYEEVLLSVFDGGAFRAIGLVSPVAVRAVHDSALELSWYPNTSDRFHEVSLTLPRSKVRACIGYPDFDLKPTIFVDSSWLDELHAKSFSVFALVDAVDIRNLSREGKLSRASLLALRSRLDALSAGHPQAAFISFADSILIKSNWTVGSIHNELSYTYRPEAVVEIAGDVRAIFRDTLGTGSYTVLAQGYNEYYSDELLHVATSQNHVCLNSLGVPFARLTAIDRAARKAIRQCVHPAAELYMDQGFYHSLRLRFEYEKNKRPRAPYDFKMSEQPSYYYYADVETILDNVETRTMAERVAAIRRRRPRRDPRELLP
jgi:hypothetical protein